MDSPLTTYKKYTQNERDVSVVPVFNKSSGLQSNEKFTEATGPYETVDRKLQYAEDIAIAFDTQIVFPDLTHYKSVLEDCIDLRNQDFTGVALIDQNTQIVHSWIPNDELTDAFCEIMGFRITTEPEDNVIVIPDSTNWTSDGPEVIGCEEFDPDEFFENEHNRLLFYRFLYGEEYDMTVGDIESVVAETI